MHRVTEMFLFHKPRHSADLLSCISTRSKLCLSKPMNPFSSLLISHNRHLKSRAKNQIQILCKQFYENDPLNPSKISHLFPKIFTALNGVSTPILHITEVNILSSDALRFYTVPQLHVISGVSKVIWDCFVFALIRSVIGSENSCHSPQPIIYKTKTNHDVVVRSFPRLVDVTLSSHELFKVFSFCLLCFCSYFCNT